MSHSPTLDGIRGIAILAVLLFHSAPGLLPGGFAGVDVFFVLSGFLLTRRILSEMRRGNFRICTFLLRRAMRILPNLTLMVISVVLLWSWIFPPGVTRDLAQQGLWTLYCIPNLYLWSHLGTYWGQAAHWSPLTHTWSLGVEEQFYMVLPVFIAITVHWKLLGISTSISTLLLLSLGIWSFGLVQYPIATFYLLPSRAWELLLGCLVASIRSRDSPAGRHPHWMSRVAVGWLGIALVLTSMTFKVGQETSSFWNSAPAAIGCAMLLSHLTSSASPSVGLLWALGGQGIGTVGRLSYSLYLWHWPLVTLGGYLAERWNLDITLGKATGTLASLVPAILAYRHVELPCRRVDISGLRKLALVTATLLTTTATCGWMTQTQPTGPGWVFDPPHYSRRIYDAGRLFVDDWSVSTRYRGVQFPSVPGRVRDSWHTGGVIHHYGGGDPTVVVLGSSHALMYASMIDRLCAEMRVSVAFLCLDGGASAFFENRKGLNFDSDSAAERFDRVRMSWIQAWKPTVLVVLDRWEVRAEDAFEFEGKIRTFLKEVRPYSMHQIFAAQPPVLAGVRDNNLLELVQWEAQNRSEPAVFRADWRQKTRDQYAQVLEKMAMELEGVLVLRPDLRLLSSKNRVQHLNGRTLLYIDDNHLSDEGTELFRPLFQKALTHAIHGSRPLIRGRD